MKLRTINYDNPYEKLKELTWGKTNLNQQEFRDVIKNLHLEKTTEDELINLKLSDYSGYSKDIN